MKKLVQILVTLIVSITLSACGNPARTVNTGKNNVSTNNGFLNGSSSSGTNGDVQNIPSSEAADPYTICRTLTTAGVFASTKVCVHNSQSQMMKIETPNLSSTSICVIPIAEYVDSNKEYYYKTFSDQISCGTTTGVITANIGITNDSYNYLVVLPEANLNDYLKWQAGDDTVTEPGRAHGSMFSSFTIQ